MSLLTHMALTVVSWQHKPWGTPAEHSTQWEGEVGLEMGDDHGGGEG